MSFLIKYTIDVTPSGSCPGVLHRHGRGGRFPGRGDAGFGGQDAGAAEQHRDGQEDETVGESADGDPVGRHPATELMAEDVAGAVGEVDACGDDGDPDGRVWQVGPGYRAAGFAVVGDVDQRGGEDAEQQARRQARDLKKTGRGRTRRPP